MKILAIDDNPDNLTSLKAVVSDRLPGVIVLTATNGTRGLDVARTEDPDVILLDIVMPGMDGYAVCRKLKEDVQLQTIPVLFLTANRTDRDSRVKALEAGAEGFLSKPFDEVELSAQIRAMVKIKVAMLDQRNAKERLAALVEDRTRALQESHLSMLNLLEDLQVENEAREKGNQALRESEARLMHAQLLTRMGSYDLNLTDERWVSSPILDEILGIDESYPRTLEGWTSLLHPDWRALMTDSLANSTPEKNARFDHEFKIIRPNDGMECWVHGLGELEFDDRGQPLRMIGAIQDITRRKQTDEAIASQLVELRRWQSATLGREGRIAELKREVNALAEQLGQVRPYATPEELERQAKR